MTGILEEPESVKAPLQQLHSVGHSSNFLKPKMRLFCFLSLVALASPVLSATHYLYSGFFSGSTIVGIEFDDVASTLTIKNNITTQAEATSGSKWIALDVSTSLTVYTYICIQYRLTRPSNENKTSMYQQPATSKATPSLPMVAYLTRAKSLSHQTVPSPNLTPSFPFSKSLFQALTRTSSPPPHHPLTPSSAHPTTPVVQP
jgi:hypothetical protein